MQAATVKVINFYELRFELLHFFSPSAPPRAPSRGISIGLAARPDSARESSGKALLLSCAASALARPENDSWRIVNLPVVFTAPRGRDHRAPLRPRKFIIYLFLGGESSILPLSVPLRLAGLTTDGAFSVAFRSLSTFSINVIAEHFAIEKSERIGEGVRRATAAEAGESSPKPELCVCNMFRIFILFSLLMIRFQ